MRGGRRGPAADSTHLTVLDLLLNKSNKGAAEPPTAAVLHCPGFIEAIVAEADAAIRAHDAPPRMVSPTSSDGESSGGGYDDEDDSDGLDEMREAAAAMGLSEEELLQMFMEEQLAGAYDSDEEDVKGEPAKEFFF